MSQEYIVEAEDTGIRIDRYLSERCADISRSYFQKLLKEEEILVDGLPVKSNYKVTTGNRIQVTIPKAREPEIEPEEMKLDILYEDKDIILINKPKRMVVHPAAGHYTGTLVNGLMDHCRGDLSGINGVMRPGIVHRIDMDTTGVLIVCKNDMSHQSIANQLKEHTITRKYYAIVHGVVKCEEGIVDAPIGRHPVDRKKMSINQKNGKNAITHYRVLEYLKQFTYVECQLETGRTHQIRVHMASIGHPLLGDAVYGPMKSPYHLTGQTLHAGVLGIIHPRSGEYMEFHAPLPEYFSDLLRKLRTT
ncbi:RluA family pseudouridine synthase [Clostridium sp. E02]|uniref:RluA family pseudouridine synthase n=1 Tax=Clostridium sp. E02 TaxID=2487134 RepID=UPI000F53664B|nr:RluA family pseudouridine synthase [Clostridium sp. E02]